MKNKVFIVFMEQIIMILVFSICAAICLNIFFYSQKVSEKSALKAEAALVAQNIADKLKAENGEFFESGIWKKEGSKFIKEENDFIAELEFIKESEDLKKAELTIKAGDEKLFTIPVAWRG